MSDSNKSGRHKEMQCIDQSCCSKLYFFFRSPSNSSFDARAQNPRGQDDIEVRPYHNPKEQDDVEVRPYQHSREQDDAEVMPYQNLRGQDDVEVRPYQNPWEKDYLK